MSSPVPSSPPRRGFLAAVAALFTASGGRLRAEPGPLTLATSTPGGGFAAYGQTLERVLNRLAGRTLVQAVPTGGTGENLELLAQGRVDAALIQGTAASEVLARPGLDDARAAAFIQAMQEAAAELAEALPQAAAELAEALPQAAFSTLRNKLASTPDPALLHTVLRVGR